MAGFGGVEGLAAAGSSLGIPQPGAVPGQGGGLEGLLASLTSGQMSPEKMLALLALLTGGMGGGPPGQMPMQGPPPGMGGGGMPPGMGGGGPPPGMMGPPPGMGGGSPIEAAMLGGGLPPGEPPLL